MPRRRPAHVHPRHIRVLSLFTTSPSPPPTTTTTLPKYTHALPMTQPLLPPTAAAVPNGTRTATTKPSKAKSQRPIDPNVLEVGFGNLLIKPWYPSFYPEELVGRTVDRLYVCQWCFKYSAQLIKFLGHLKVCECRERPPGEEVYVKGGYSLYEVDGEECRVCMNEQRWFID